MLKVRKISQRRVSVPTGTKLIVWDQNRRSTTRTARSPRHKSLITTNARTLLWIDDYEPGLAVYKSMFESMGFRVLTASRGSLGLRLAAANPIDAVIVDYEMPEMDGCAVASALKRRDPSVPIIMFSGSGQIPNRARHLIDGFCDKAASRDHLLATLDRVLVRKSLQPRPHRVASDRAHRTVA